jgi:tRNA-specific 2-thiouridylase
MLSFYGMKKTQRARVVVAMSGGVDSSVAAGLLKEAGHEVIGVTMNLFSLPPEICRSEDLRSCCGWKATEDAHEAACRLGIDHLVVDFRREFESRVIADFCREYGRGRTPNPCVRCNEHIKFGLLLKRAKRLGADFIATGHYARIKFDKRNGRYLIKRGKDRAKDQSYFLYPLTQAQLSRTLFPVGDFSKTEVRRLAKKWDLPVASKAESQEICFVPLGRYPDFLRERVPEAFRPGPIVDRSGRILAMHKGIGHFTVGQRRGMGIAGPRPLYVVAIDAASNSVFVGANEDLYQNTLIAGRVNLISMERVEAAVRVKAKIRYKHEAVSATLIPLSKGRLRVEFDRPQRAITPGQSVVFYQRDIVVGGGIIERAFDR